jgi:hypothetical protein
MSVYSFFYLRRAEEERMRAARAKTPAGRLNHLYLARKFEDRARSARDW